jgi:hypothetical protein
MCRCDALEKREVGKAALLGMSDSDLLRLGGQDAKGLQAGSLKLLWKGIEVKATLARICRLVSRLAPLWEQSLLELKRAYPGRHRRTLLRVEHTPTLPFAESELPWAGGEETAAESPPGRRHPLGEQAAYTGAQARANRHACASACADATGRANSL